MVNAALSEPRPAGLMIEVTSKCNLRCVYCDKSLESDATKPGRNEDMTPEVIEKVVQLIDQLSLSELLMSGTGETSFHPDWINIVSKLTTKSRSRNPKAFICLNSNFARDFSEIELDTLLQFNHIMVSVDTVDPKTLKDVRKKVSAEKIFFNISKLAARAALRGVRKPYITMNCTLTDRVYKDLKELYFVASRSAVDKLVVSDVYENDELIKKFQFRNVMVLPQEEIVRLASDLNEIINHARSGKYIQFDIQPGLRQSIVNRLNNPHAQRQNIESTTIAAGNTKVCLQPWTRYTIGANGDVFPCCITSMEPLSNIKDGVNPFYSPAAQTLRENLLKGGEHVPEVCRGCTNAPEGSVASLEQLISGAPVAVPA